MQQEWCQKGNLHRKTLENDLVFVLVIIKLIVIGSNFIKRHINKLIVIKFKFIIIFFFFNETIKHII